MGNCVVIYKLIREREVLMKLSTSSYSRKEKINNRINEIEDMLKIVLR